MSLALKRAVESHRRLEGEVILLKKQLGHHYTLLSKVLENSRRLRYFSRIIFGFSPPCLLLFYFRTWNTNFDTESIFPIEAEHDLFTTLHKSASFCQDIKMTVNAIGKLLNDLPQVVPFPQTEGRRKMEAMAGQVKDGLTAQIDACERTANALQSYVLDGTIVYEDVEILSLLVKRQAYVPFDTISQLALLVKTYSMPQAAVVSQ